MHSARRVALLVPSLLLAAGALWAHNQSPRASVSQQIGDAKVTVDYSRPGVKGREIWGALVPYGQVWKTGADQMTNITLDHELSVGGHRLPAGTYGILAIPGEKSFTLILTKRADIFRPTDYKGPDEDALRLELEPQRTADSKERLEFSFDQPDMSSAQLVLHWEHLEVSVPISE